VSVGTLAAICHPARNRVATVQKVLAIPATPPAVRSCRDHVRKSRIVAGGRLRRRNRGPMLLTYRTWVRVVRKSGDKHRPGHGRGVAAWPRSGIGLTGNNSQCGQNRERSASSNRLFGNQ
jgi:hypothetical protein